VEPSLLTVRHLSEEAIDHVPPTTIEQPEHPLLVIGVEISRWIGVVAPAIGAVTTVSWLPYYPVSSLTYIPIAVLVIYGLIAHFESPIELQAHRRDRPTVSGTASE